MKLIIDIDKDYYKAIWENGYIYDEDNEDIAKIIKQGTPLPKGHGRLIDADALVKKGDITKDYLNIFAPTIIEADKGGNEK